MRELREAPLQGIPIYNPQLLGRDDLLRTFVARHEELAQIVEQLRREATGQPQHHLIVGARGMGKTTLLARIRHAIEDDGLLTSRCLPLVFPEEQYNVGSLADFWLNCVDALADMLEVLHKVDLVEVLDREVARVLAVSAEQERRRLALDLLCELSTRLDRRLVLLVDNVDMVLDRLQGEDWALREVLSAEARIQLIGATSAPLESYYRHDRAFYDFFRVHHLSGLSEDETFTVLGKLAAATGNDKVERLLAEEPGRIKTVRLVSGGNPRTIVLMFSLLERGVDGDVRSDIERLLDLCTPLYKHRIEVLPPQAQQVIDALAMNWHPTSAAAIAAVIHLKVNVVSSQLERLVRDGTVEKVAMPGTSRLGFQISERFFNIWCLMRGSRRVRRRLAWFVEFLRMMFGLDELERLARRHLEGALKNDRMRRAEMGLALADAIEETSMRYALETDSVRALCADRDTRGRLAEILDLEGQDVGLVSRAERLRLLAEAREAILAAGEGRPGWDAEEFWSLLAASLDETVEEKHRVAHLIKNVAHTPVDAVHALLRKNRAIYQQAVDAEELEALLEAVRVGDLDVFTMTAQELMAAGLVHGQAIIPCALSLAPKGSFMDFELFTRTVRSSRSLEPRVKWAELARMNGVSAEEVAEGLHEVVDANDWSASALVSLGAAFRVNVDDPSTAETLFKRALARDARLASPHHGLALVYLRMRRFDEAEAEYRTAISLAPKSAALWEGLGMLLVDHLKRYEEGEAALRESVLHDRTRAHVWFKLGQVVGLHLGRYKEAEVACREMLTLAPDSIYGWLMLGRLLVCSLGRPAEGEAAFEKAVALAPEDAYVWNAIAWSRYIRGDLSDASLEAARTAVRLEGKVPSYVHTLSTILVTRGEWAEAEPYVRQFIAGDVDFLNECWSDILRFFAEAVVRGFHAEARALLVSMGLEERWEPLVRGLEVVARGTQLMGAYAPEMREAVRLVLRQIAPGVLEE